MAIDIAPINSLSPAFLRLSPSILDAARPQIEPVGYNQRYGFVGNENPLERANETSPSYLRTFVESPSAADSLNERFSTGTFGGDELTASSVALQPETQQLGLFGETADPAQDLGLRSTGLAQYSAVQSAGSRSTVPSLSINA